MLECTDPGNARYVELKSQFIAYCYSVLSASDFLSYLDQLHVDHPEATHYVYAYRLSHSQQLFEKFSDDGEPYGTAGLPLLSLLQKKNVINTALFVVRYYGGVKLGKKGLFSAYLNTAIAAIAKASFKEKRKGYMLQIHLTYPVFPFFEKWLADRDAVILEREFSGSIILKIWIEEKVYEMFIDSEFESLCTITGKEKMNML
jgi:uncharacterized YigZ family protein